jgi:hypothetical protein
MHKPVLLIDRTDRAKRKVSSSKGDRGGRHGCSVETGKAMFSKFAMFGDARRNQRVRDLHKNGSRRRKRASELAVHFPEYGPGREERLRHASIFS